MDSFDVENYTTLPRRRRDRIPTAEELQEMSLERRLATLNISQHRVPVPPPRVKRIQKRMSSLPDTMTTSPTKSQELYAEKSSYSFDDDTRHNIYDNRYEDDDYRGYKTSQKQSYYKYEVSRKDYMSDNDKDLTAGDQQPMCDIIQSSQRSPSKTKPLLQMRRPDILRGSFTADLRSKLSDSSQTGKPIHSQPHIAPSKDKGSPGESRSNFDNNKNLVYSGSSSRKASEKRDVTNGKQDPQSSSNSKSSNTHGRLADFKRTMKLNNISSNRSCDSISTTGTNNRSMFYRPKTDKLSKQHSSALGLVGMVEVNYNGGSLTPSPEGSFVNPAFDIIDNPETDRPKLSTSTQIKPVATPSRPVAMPSRPVYSTMGSSFSTRPCTPSPPSHRFRNQRAPLPNVEPNISPIKPLGPVPIKPMMSTKQLETSLKQYPSQNRLDTSDGCSPQALESMLKYYNMSSKDDSLSNSPTPPPTKLCASKKNQSPYSSSGSLNVSGDSIDVVLRRKKKVRIRPLSFSSDDESVKRVSLEINLVPNTTSEDNLTETPPRTGNLSEWKESPKSQSQSSLNQAGVEKLDLEDLTSTETARLLRKQFAKLKVKASSLKVKDSELKQRFANLQNQRGRLCGYGGGVTKAKIRGSPILL